MTTRGLGVVVPIPLVSFTLTVWTNGSTIVWQERKYLDMDEFNEWVAAQNEAKESSNIFALAN